MTLPPLQVDIERLTSELERLATFSDCPEPPPAVTRVVFSETDLRARAYLGELYADAGLQVWVDPIGNTFARWQGSDPQAPAVGTGSHTDAIPHAGMYDGTVGVLGGLEAIRTLQRAGFVPRRSMDVVMFTSEEPTRFGIGCTGSRALAGLLSPEKMQNLLDAEGDNYDIVRQRAGFTGELSEIPLSQDHYHAWVELHIEQGPLLERSRIPIGVVTAIAAPATAVFHVAGIGGHAGGVLMPGRRDALCAAAEMVVAIERLALETGGADLVATVGQLEVHPGAVNSIPSRARFTLDLRDIDGTNRDRLLTAMTDATLAIATRRQVDLTFELLNADPPASSDETILTAIRAACRDSQLEFQEMISRAYHDTLFMARVVPMGMIFIPCRGGVSHRPDEFSTPEQIAAGVEVLARTLAALAGG